MAEDSRFGMTECGASSSDSLHIAITLVKVLIAAQAVVYQNAYLIRSEPDGAR